MLFRENIAVCSEIHTSTVWAECRIFNVKNWYLQWLLILEVLRQEDMSNKKVQSPLFLILALVGSKFSASHCGQYIPRLNATSTYLAAGWVYSSDGLAHYPIYRNTVPLSSIS